MRTALVLSAFGLVLASCNTTVESTGSTAIAMEANLLVAAEAAQTCQELMPNFDAIKGELVSQGFSRKEGTSSIDLFATADWGVTTQLQLGDVPNWICVVTVDGMTSDQAVAFAQPWVDAIDASLLSDSGRDVVSVWRGKDEAYDAVVVVYEPFRAPKIQGASIKLEYRRAN
ncbi:MAG: hypothetical protein AAGF71_11625 [Pseudomonadota bacterium]